MTLAFFIHIRDTLKRQELKLPNNKYKRNCNKSYKQNILIVISLSGCTRRPRGGDHSPKLFPVHLLLVSFFILLQDSNHRQQHTADSGEITLHGHFDLFAYFTPPYPGL